MKHIEEYNLHGVPLRDYPSPETFRYTTLSPKQKTNWVWFALAFLISVLTMAALFLPTMVQTVENETAELESSVAGYGVMHKMYSAGISFAFGEQKNMFVRDREKLILELLDDLKNRVFKTEGARGEAARYILILEQSLEEPPPPDFSKLNYETDDILDDESSITVRANRKELNEILMTVYGSVELSSEDAERLEESVLHITRGSFPYSLAIERIHELSGIERHVDYSGILITVFFAFLAVIAGVILVFVYMILAASRKIKPLGIPVKGDAQVGDSLGFRALLGLIFISLVPVAFLILFGGLAQMGVDDSWAMAFSTGCSLIVFLLIFKAPYINVSISLKQLGISFSNFFKNAMWGVAGALANIPILFVLVILSQLIFQWVPTRSHPVEQELIQAPSALPVFFAAVVLAPIFEEIVFRGCFFQGLVNRGMSVAWAIFLSSMSFAIIHPQGGGLWLPLAWIGAMGAILTYYTKSLIPAIVMHAVHNFGTLWIATNLLDYPS